MSDGKVVFDITGNLSGINSALDNATNTIARQTAKWTVLGQTAMNALTSTVKAGFSFVKDLALNSFEYNASMETYAVNFKTLLGSAEAAQRKIAELKEYAAKTPFAMDDLAGATQTLLAFGLNSEDASLALKHLGDISLGDANKLQSLTLAFSQISSTGKLMGQDLLQMINAGFNPLKVIAEETGAAYADLKAVMSGEKTSEDFALRMEAARKEVEELGAGASESAIMLAQIGEDGMISADMVARAMQLATSEGGAFYKALENASKTAKGQLATIADGWDMLIGNLGKGGFDYLSLSLFPKVIEWLDKLNAAYEKNGLEGIKSELPAIMDEVTAEVLDVASTIYAAVYEALTGQVISKEDAKAQIQDLFRQIGEFFAQVQELVAKVTGIIDWVAGKLGISSAKKTADGIVGDWQDVSDHYAAPDPFYNFEGWSDHDMAAAVDYIKAYAQIRKGNKEYTDMMVNSMKAINEGQKEDAASFATAVDELFRTIENGDPVQIPAEWLDGTDAELQAALSGMNLSATVSVNPVVNKTSTFGGLLSLFGGIFGQDHAAGGLFNSATRFLGADGMHTFGESGTEALLPLDTLWRKMGLTFDQAFQHNLGALQYSVMPTIPAATPSAGIDEDKLAETIAAAVKEAVSGLTVEMDKRTVGKILKPVISREIADDVNNRRWTS